MLLSDDINIFLDYCKVPQTGRQRLFGNLEIVRHNLEEAACAINLSRLVKPLDFWVKHVADSLSLFKAVPDLRQNHFSLADIGPGAGFPMLPLAHANTNLATCGIEPAKKKANFIQQQIETLKLTNCSVCRMAAKEASHNRQLRGTFDIVVARAVGKADKIIRESRLLLRNNHPVKIVLYKTPGQINEEKESARREADKFGFRMNLSTAIQLPMHAGFRQFIILYK